MYMIVLNASMAKRRTSVVYGMESPRGNNAEKFGGISLINPPLSPHNLHMIPPPPPPLDGLMNELSPKSPCGRKRPPEDFRRRLVPRVDVFTKEVPDFSDTLS